MKKYPLLTAAAVFVVLSIFFKFALIGYTTLSLVFLGVAAVLCFFHFAAKYKLRKCAAAVSALLVVGFAVFMYFEIPVISAATGDRQPESDYIIVLGAGVNGSTPSLSMRDRLTAAKAYLEEYPESFAVLSGGQGPGEDLTEALAMYNWLVSSGISPERLLLEEQATSTEENLKFSLDVISAHGGDVTGNIAICSSEYHLCRAKLMAEELGFSPLTVPARTSNPLLAFNYFIREAFAMAYYKVF